MFRSTTSRILVFTALLTVASFAQAQSKSRHPGIVLFEQAKFDEAVRSLESAVKTDEYKSDAEIWNYLGLSYLANDSLKKGRKAFEKSVSLQPSNPIFRSNLAFTLLMARQWNKAMDAANEATKLNPKIPGPYQVRASVYLSRHDLGKAEREVDTFIQLDPRNPQAYVLKSDILMTMLSDRFMDGRAVKDEIELLKRAEAALKVGKEQCKARCDEIAHELESVAAFTAYFSKPTNSPLLPPDAEPPPPPPGVTPLKILSTPKASYTDIARAENVQGSIRVVILLGASGRVEQIMFLSKLGHGLDQEVVKAARQIKFEPKKVDGKPVSTVIVREYTFSIY